eukprot:COSAG06_NODE_2253_length_7231_cov_5.051178_5_plen_65_part_00
MLQRLLAVCLPVCLSVCLMRTVLCLAAAFCPIFRLHGSRSGPQDKTHCGSNGFNEVWTFGDTGT